MFVQITGDEFDAKYELLKCVTEVGVRTYQAQNSDGQVVMVHFLGLGSIEENQDRLSRIDALAQPARDRVIEMIDIDGSIIIVTQFLTQFDNFDEWLRNESGAPGGAGANRAAASSSAETVQLQTPIEALPEEQRPQVPAASSEPDEGQPGEFTQMFTPDSVAELDGATTIGAGGETEPAPSVRQTEGAERPAAVEPGEFTRMFGSDSTSRLDEATRVPSDTEAEPQGAQPVREEATGEPVAAEPGEFTQMFQPTADGRTPAGGPDDAAPAGAPLDESPTGEATQPFRPSVETAGVVDGQEPPVVESPPAQQQPPGPRKPVIRWRGDKPTEPHSGEQPQVRWKGPQDSQPRVPPPPQVPTTPPPLPVQPPAPQAGVPPIAGAPPPTPEPTQQGPGEFTQMFHDGSAAPTASGPPEIPGHNTDPRRSLSSMQQDDLGLGGSMPPAADPLKAAQPPGQFTQMFRSGSGLDEPRPEVPLPPEQQPPPEQGKKPGSFTEIFGSTGEPSDYPLPAVKPQSTPQPVQPPAPPPPGGQPPMVSAAPPSAPPVPPPGAAPVSPFGGQPGAVPPQAPPPQAQGPGEFTRMVSDTPATPPQMVPPPPPPAVDPVGAYAGSGAETPKKSQLPLLIVGLSVILVLAVVLILVVVLT